MCPVPSGEQRGRDATVPRKTSQSFSASAEHPNHLRGFKKQKPWITGPYPDLLNCYIYKGVKYQLILQKSPLVNERDFLCIKRFMQRRKIHTRNNFFKHALTIKIQKHLEVRMVVFSCLIISRPPFLFQAKSFMVFQNIKPNGWPLLGEREVRGSPAQAPAHLKEAWAAGRIRHLNV